MTTPPIIVIGMHRSGTTLITDMLASLGMFPGAMRDQYEEAVFFQNLNEWLFRQAGGSWDNPEAIRHLLQNDEARARALAILRDLISSPRAFFYLGPGSILSTENIFSMRRSWGWKDPRNTFLLPLWLEIFPDARVIHVVRHGVDVAESLNRRALESLRSHDSFLQRLQRRTMPRPQRFAQSLVCLDLFEGLKLWDRYLDEANFQIEKVGNRGLRIVYENLLADPAPVYSQLAALLDQPEDQNQLAELARSIRNCRRFAFARDEKLLAFARQHEAILMKHGYSCQVVTEK